LKLFVLPERVSSRSAILAAISSFIVSLKDRESLDEVLQLLQPYTDDVVGVISVGIKSATDRKIALSSLSNSVRIKKWFSDEELGFLIHEINETLFSEESNDATWYVEF
jgi:DNA repair/transcription protein MET18/MMS19